MIIRRFDPARDAALLPGLATLFAAVEAEALAHGRTTLVLDTVTGSPAEAFYRRCGWPAIGSIAAYARMPDGAMAATTIFARHL